MEIGDQEVDLYALDRMDLRLLAYEALLISDGPDRIAGDTSFSAIGVRLQEDGTFEVWRWPEQ